MLGPALFAVARGQEVGKVGGAVLRAPQAGVLRGLTRDNVLVAAGAKVVEVDPRGRLEVAGGSASGRAASRRAASLRSGAGSCLRLRRRWPPPWPPSP